MLGIVFGFDEDPTFTASAGGTLVIGDYRGVSCAGSFNTDVHTLVYRGVSIAPTLGGVVDLAVGVELSLTGATTTMSLRSASTDATMRHKGNARFGDTLTAPVQKLETVGNILLDNTGTASQVMWREPSASGANVTTMRAQAMAANVDYVLPAAQGAVNTVLTNDGAGILSWTASGSGSQGIQGVPGFDGEDGMDSFVPGPTGATGATGSTGANGAPGSMGPPGLDGEDFNNGIFTGGTVGGMGTPTQVAYWNSSSTIAGDPQFVFKPAYKGIVIGQASTVFGSLLGADTAGIRITRDAGDVGGASIDLEGYSTIVEMSTFTSNGSFAAKSKLLTGDQLFGLAMNGALDLGGGVISANNGAIIQAIATTDWNIVGINQFQGCQLDFYSTATAVNSLAALSLSCSGPSVSIAGTSSTFPATFQVGATDQFRVDSVGNLIRIRDVLYSWPAAQGAASTVLTNDGAGTLSWATSSAASTSPTLGLQFLIVEDDSEPFALPNIPKLSKIPLPLPLDHHADLTNFTANDDHTQYTLVAGRTGTTNDTSLSTSTDGTLSGSTASGKDLILQSTTHATKGGVRLISQTANPSTLTPGLLWYRSDATTQQRLNFTQGDSVADQVTAAIGGVTLQSTADSTTVNGGTGGDQVLDSANFSFPIGFFTVGKAVRLSWAVKSTTAGVVTFDFKVNLGTLGTVTILDFGTQTMDSVGTANLATRGTALLVCRATGGTGTVIGTGEMVYQTANTPTFATKNARGSSAAIDTTAQQLLRFKVAIAGAGAGAADTCTLEMFQIEVLN
jgi:hypothetical protein